MTIFNVIFITVLLVMLILPIYFKLKDYKSIEEWEEIKRQNSKEMEILESKQDPDKGLYVKGIDPY